MLKNDGIENPFGLIKLKNSWENLLNQWFFDFQNVPSYEYMGYVIGTMAHLQISKTVLLS